MPDNVEACCLMPPGRSIIVADRRYDDSLLWKDWDSRGISFVVRLRRDIKFKRLEAFEQPWDKEQDILVDEAVRLMGEMIAVSLLQHLKNKSKQNWHI